MSVTRMQALCGVILVGLALGTPSRAQSDVTVTPLAESPSPVVEALPEAGAKAVAGDAAVGQGKAAVCGACHGMDGNSTDPQYPKLAGQHERYIARHLTLFKSGERSNPIMLGFAAALSAQDMRDLGAWFASQKVSPGLADDTMIQDGPYAGQKFWQVGEALWRGGNAARGIPACAACHGPTGAGNPGPPYPALAGQHARYTADMLHRFREGTSYGKGDNANEVMRGVASMLTDTEIDALASFIEGLHEREAVASAE